MARLLAVAALPVISAGMLGEKPLMGWRSWNAFGLKVDQASMLAQVRALKAAAPNGRSLLEAGYGEIGIDDGWQSCGAGVGGGFHDESGKPIVNKSLFPDMLAMTREAHREGVKMGWYMNNCWCGSIGQKGGYPVQDVAATVAFEFDGLKVDGCGQAHNITVWAEALAASAREVVLENCADNTAEIQWTAATPADVQSCGFQLYRVSVDIAPHYNSVMWNLQYNIPFLDDTKPLSRPGCWAYPDMLQVGSTPWGSLSFAESRSHFAAWCITSSPLVLGFDLTNESLMSEVYPIISNRRAIAVDQAWYGHPGRLVRNNSKTVRLPVPHYVNCLCCDDLSKCLDFWDAPLTQLWTKPLGQGKAAVLALNHGSETQQECFTAEDLGFTGSLSITDVWTGRTTPVGSRHCCDLVPHDSCFLTVEVTATAIFM